MALLEATGEGWHALGGRTWRGQYWSVGARVDGYLPIRDYAAVGDGRMVALVGRDGSIDWLCFPDLDSASLFGGVLDSRRGGRFVVSPAVPYEVERRYVPDTNVLETTFRTAEGSVRVTDACTTTGEGLVPQRELLRRIEGLAGRVPMRWSVEPRFGYGLGRTRLGRRGGVPVAWCGADAVAVCSWDAGEAGITRSSIEGACEVPQGGSAMLAMSGAFQEPLVFPARDGVERRLDATAAMWRCWAADRGYDGLWRDAVLRSALALKLLVYAPSGAVAAAPTTSLPEELGGSRNWDYRYCWVRDAAFTLQALLALGCAPEADAFFWWLMQASQLTRPRLNVLYRLDGGTRAPERELPLEGYRGASPVRIGNEASAQLQLDIYGDLFQAVWRYTQAGRVLDADLARRLAATADLVCGLWRCPDAGIWEVRSEPVHFTQSKMMCWVALDRAVRLADAGSLPRRHVHRWRREAEAIRSFVEEHCWSERRGSYGRSAGVGDLDAGLLVGVLFGYPPPDRARRTVDAIRGELARDDLVDRYHADDGLSGTDGAFVACSFWLVEALARTNRAAEAGALMERLLERANDIGLYPEEIDPATGEFLGNFPQALTHLALINAAVALTEHRP